MDFLEIRGAAIHNLRHIHVKIPKHRLVVFTGVSGSGKSSLAFDTIYAEGQRRYVESLSAYARQFLGQMEKPPYDSIRGLSPTISIEQKAASSNPRSTVGTITEINDYLRVLYARAGTQHCHQCGQKVGQQSADQITDEILKLPAGEDLLLAIPLLENRKGEHKEILAEIAREGYSRVRVGGEIRRIDDLRLDKKKKHDIDVVVDRLALDAGDRPRLAEAVEQALRRGDGVIKVVRADGSEMILSEKNACHRCHISFPELTPQLFSFNSPQGMCGLCDGLGRRMEFDPRRLVPDDTLSLAEGAVVVWPAIGASEQESMTGERLRLWCQALEIALDRPWRDLPAWQKNFLMFGRQGGGGGPGRGELARLAERFGFDHEGLINTLVRRFRETGSNAAKAFYHKFLDDTHCSACQGSRLRAEASAVRVDTLSFTEFSALTIRDAHDAIGVLKIAGARNKVVQELVKEIRNRLGFLLNVGLDYLSLSRAGPTLSGGESQRIRLASQVGSELTGVMYILDEPSIGLHQRDNRKLIDTLQHLRDIGNSVIIVEHDQETIESADHIVDFGPGAGVHGGRVVVSGTLSEVRAHPKSVTGAYLSAREHIPVPSKRRTPGAPRLVIRNAREHNLKNLDVALPLGLFVAVTGVSGAGKSTLVNAILYPALSRFLHGSRRPVGMHDAIDGLTLIDKVVDIDQKPIGRTPRSNPATYVKVFDHIRDLFASTKEARRFGFQPGRFSFNVKGGRCEACQGDGMIRVEMHFLADVFIPCEVCRGQRFNQQTLKVLYQGKTISDVLDMTIGEARKLFRNLPKIAHDLETLCDVGLDYLRLGQPSPTLSGGEAQRVKLSRELTKLGTGKTVYILDEPTTGLHFDDIRKLLLVLQRLVDAGNTVVVIEHNLDVIKSADWVIDLGPEGGERGGFLVAQGTPEHVALIEPGHTGRYLRKVLDLTAPRKTRVKRPQDDPPTDDQQAHAG